MCGFEGSQLVRGGEVVAHACGPVIGARVDSDDPVAALAQGVHGRSTDPARGPGDECNSRGRHGAAIAIAGTRLPP